MPFSIFELFKIGVGPSSSHTMGPMTAGCRFAARLEDAGKLEATARVTAALYASLALTGRGHATDTAVIVGLHGVDPESVGPDGVASLTRTLRETGTLMLAGRQPVPFQEERDLLWHGAKELPFHPNGVTFTAFDATGAVLDSFTYYSIGGGFVLNEDEAAASTGEAAPVEEPYPYRSAAELLAVAQRHGLSIAQVALANEDARRPRDETTKGIARILGEMDRCIDRGLAGQGELPGGLRVRRRAQRLYADLQKRMEKSLSDPLAMLDWVNLWAIAVNEENAAGGKVVTAPTNGAAGVIPSVLRYHERLQGGTVESLTTFLLTASAIGALYKRNASISAAEVGCQGEVGVACSMAAAGLAAVMGGSNAQIENAAEIGMEHNLGLTCDPIGGLVQIPCIERNAMGAVKAIDAARLALNGDGDHYVSLDHAIDTMLRTGQDMKANYKETALGGLAVFTPAC
jgi:L-serine dehydratase